MDSPADQSITNLISNIEMLVKRQDPLVSIIKSPKLVCRGLNELKSMVEMVNIKESIVKQIKFLLVNKARRPSLLDDEGKFEGHMLHCTIAGKPGTGKTTVARILAKIWMGLGLIKKPVVQETPTEGMPNLNNMTFSVTFVQHDDTMTKRIDELEKNNRTQKRKLDTIRDGVLTLQSRSNKIRTHLMKMKSDSTNPNDYNDLMDVTRDIRKTFDQLIPELFVEKANVVEKAPEIADPYTDEDPTFVVATRADLVGKYVGHTAPKTKKVLEKALGGVLFIDEAYSICQSGSDKDFGAECLTVINEFMSDHPDEIIIIFAGYKDLLKSTIFQIQPGLRRRCHSEFEIEDYTPSGLAKIFNLQLKKHNWKLDEKVDVVSIFIKYKDLLKDGGGSTEKLAALVKTEYGLIKFDETLLSQTTFDSVITEKMIINALAIMKANGDNQTDSEPPMSMYL